MASANLERPLRFASFSYSVWNFGMEFVKGSTSIVFDQFVSIFVFETAAIQVHNRQDDHPLGTEAVFSNNFGRCS